MRHFVYFLRQAIANIKNNRLIHFIGLSTMAISILILGVFILLYVNVYGWIQRWGGSMNMSIYLEEGLGKKGLERIERFIKNQDCVLTYEHVSKEKAFEEFKEALGPQSKLLSNLATNPLPASFEVEIKADENQGIGLKELAKRIEKLDGVEEVQYSEAWIRRFKDVLGMVKVIGFVVGGLLALGALFVVTNTIKLTIYSRKDEIEILKLVGATDWFIKTPFLIEGMIQGILAALVALGGLYLAFVLFSAKKTTFLNLAAIKLEFIPWAFLAGIIVLSFIVGAIGSLIAVGRFFEVARS